MHTPEYDESGRLIRTVVEREPEFDDEQYQMLAALAEHEASLNELGIPLDEAMSKGADPDNRNGTHRYVVETAIDWSIHARDLAQKARSGPDDEYGRSRKYFVTREDR